MSIGVFEKQLAQVWRKQWLDAAGLTTEGGQRVKVIHPGRPNTDDRGPDFRNCVIQLDEVVLTGDIEIHVRSEDWQAHGHHLDPAYDSVVLHVVLFHDTARPARHRKGTDVPVLSLRDRLNAPASAWWHDAADSPGGGGEMCRDAARRLGENYVLAILDRAGDASFAARSIKLENDVTEEGPAQALYQGIMRALGYSRNKLPFLELSRRLPLRILEAKAGEMNEAPETDCARLLYAIMLDEAGLAPPVQRAQGPAVQSCCPPNRRRFSPEAGAARNMDWNRFRVRPGNSPEARLAVMSRLLARYRRRGLLDATLVALAQAPEGREDSWLRAAYSVPGMGGDRVADIVINVVLPFAQALGRITGREELCRRALRLYSGYGRLAHNAVTRHLCAQFGLRPRAVTRGRCQQGLMHIYNTLCVGGKCGTCPLRRPHPETSLSPGTTSTSSPLVLPSRKRK